MHSFLSYAARKYYEGDPILSDAEFDSLAEQFGYEEVGYSTQDGVEHAFRMYSLQKVYDGIDTKPFDGIETPKLDGAAIALTYINGTLRLALTRGDGKRGQDITHLVPHLMVPEIIKTDKPVLQITGEVVAPKEIPNARNYAAGALNLKSLDEFYSRNVDFVAYGVSPCIFDTWLGDMSALHSFGFETVLSAECDKYPQDGVVVRVNNNEKFSQMGYTSHHPRGAFAVKARQEGVLTTLEDVVWQVGKSGVVSPVGLLSPVKIGDATVSRATLHNMRYIRELNLEIGCQVEVIRSGEIIPRVVRRVD